MGVKLSELYKAVERFESFVKAQQDAPAEVVATERDELKNLLFKFAGLPLVRIRADDEKAVRAEDFYDLLMAESTTLDALRPRRMRSRRTHDFLVPAESATRSTRTSAAQG